MNTSIKLMTVGLAAALSVVALTSVAASATTTEHSVARIVVVNGGQSVALPPLTAGVQPNTPARSAVTVKTSSAAINSPSSLQHRCYPAGRFLSGTEAASWLGTPTVGDSPWPADNSNRVWAANGGWVGGNMQWAMVNPGGDDMRRVYVFFRSSC